MILLHPPGGRVFLQPAMSAVTPRCPTGVKSFDDSVATPKNCPPTLLQLEKMAECVDHSPICTDSITDEVLAFDLSPTFCLEGAIFFIL